MSIIDIRLSTESMLFNNYSLSNKQRRPSAFLSHKTKKWIFERIGHISMICWTCVLRRLSAENQGVNQGNHFVGSVREIKKKIEGNIERELEERKRFRKWINKTERRKQMTRKWGKLWDFFLLFHSFESFFLQRKLIVFLWSLSDSKYPQVSRTLLGILADLNNSVVWMFSTCLFISKSYSPFTNLLGIVPSAPITISITVTIMFHSFFFSSLAMSTYLSLFSLFFFQLLLLFHSTWVTVSSGVQDSSKYSSWSLDL